MNLLPKKGIRFHNQTNNRNEHFHRERVRERKRIKLTVIEVQEWFVYRCRDDVE